MVLLPVVIPAGFAAITKSFQFTFGGRESFK
jgi:hypothetical protein